MRPPGKLLFGTAGTPHSTKPRNSLAAIARVRELGLDAMELEYVYGSFPGEDKARAIAEASRENDVRLTAHGPYYINLNAVEPEKREASRKRILDTAYFGGLSGAESITFHAGFFLKQDRDSVYVTIAEELAHLSEKIKEMSIDVDMRPELTGKATQFGSLDEIIRLAGEIDIVKPCIDWSHLHARDGESNTTKEFEAVIDIFRTSLGDSVLQDMHMHIAGIDYSPKGEKKHLNLEDSDMNWRDLLRVFKDNEVGGILVCESPSIEDDALLLKDFYDGLS